MTYIPNTIIEKTRYAAIFGQMNAIEFGDSLEAALIRMQTHKGIDEFHARANARMCMAAVAGREAIYEALSDDAAAVMEGFFQQLSEKDEANRMLALHQIYFGLTIHGDPDFTGDEKDADEKFLQYYLSAVDGANPPSAEEMEGRILQALQQYRIHPNAMKILARKLKKTNGRLATAMALGQNGRCLKCLMTMDLWLENTDTMTMEEAANAACTSVDYQAVADAVNKGYIARTVAVKILKIIAITALVVGVVGIALGFIAPHVAANGAAFLLDNPAFMATTEGMAMAKDVIELNMLAPQALSKGIGRFLFGTGLVVLSKFAAALIGTVAAGLSHLFQNSEDTDPDTLTDAVTEDAVHEVVVDSYTADTVDAPDSVFFFAEEEDEQSIF